MTKEQFLEKYAKVKTVVWCKTKELAKEFLSLCEKFDIRWLNGDNALSNLDYWEKYTDRTRYSLNEGDFLMWGSDEYYAMDRYTSIPFEPEQKTTYPVEKILEMLPVKVEVNEDFRIRGFGNELFHFDKRLKLWCVDQSVKYDIYIGDFISGKYIIEKLPSKPLLTEEEKEFLRNFKFDELIKSITLRMYDKKNVLVNVINLNNINFSFDGLEKNRKYTREELGI